MITLANFQTPLTAFSHQARFGQTEAEKDTKKEAARTLGVITGLVTGGGAAVKALQESSIVSIQNPRATMGEHTTAIGKGALTGGGFMLATMLVIVGVSAAATKLYKNVMGA